MKKMIAVFMVFASLNAFAQEENKDSALEICKAAGLIAVHAPSAVKAICEVAEFSLGQSRCLLTGVQSQIGFSQAMFQCEELVISDDQGSCMLNKLGTVSFSTALNTCVEQIITTY